MLFPQFDEIEISRISKWVGRDPIFKRGQIIKGKDVPSFYGRVDFFTSVARYNNISSYIENNQGKIGGYDGSVWMDWVVIDVDEISPKKVKLFLEHLEINYDIPIDSLRIFFSGSRGFHILIPSPLFGLRPSKLLHKVIGKIVDKIAENVIKYDPTLYDKNQILRLQFTKHSRTKLFKTPITFSELNLGGKAIKEIAKEIRYDFEFPEYIKKPINELVKLAKECCNEISAEL